MHNTTIKRENKKYLEHLWFVMHHSEDPNKETFAITCYLDESGTDGSDNKNAVMAGLLLNKTSFLSFDQDWSDLLRRKKIEPPLHMKEFGKHGRLKCFSYAERESIFTEVAEIINRHRIVSIASILNKDSFESYVHKKIRERLGFYGFCFHLCITINDEQAWHNNYKDRIAFLLDDGNTHKNHIIAARDAILHSRKTDPHYLPHTGSITFDDDKYISALQAADVIAWGVRRRSNGKKLDKGFEPIAQILDADDHWQTSWEDKMLIDLSEFLLKECEWEL
jgi:hypothetical protein